jgi:hypothetical protein
MKPPVAYLRFGRHRAPVPAIQPRTARRIAVHALGPIVGAVLCLLLPLPALLKALGMLAMAIWWLRAALRAVNILNTYISNAQKH